MQGLTNCVYSKNLYPFSLKWSKRFTCTRDSAGYQEDLLRYCAEGKDERFGVIKFAVASKVTPVFKAAVLQAPENDWQAIYKEDEKGVCQ